MRKISVTKNRLADWLIRDKYAGDRTAELDKDLARLKKKEPIDYVIGWSDFAGCKIDLSSRPLIPRPETEYWTEKAVAEIASLKNPKVLDIFSGSGCIGVAVLKHCPEARVDLAEKSVKFCEQIRTNLSLNGINPGRYKISRTDVFRSFGNPVSKLDQYNFILANPPYVPEERKLKLSKTVTAWEPDMAIFAKERGLALIKKFLQQAKNYLLPGGKIYLEFDSGQKRIIGKLLRENGYRNVVFYDDQYGRARFVVFQA